MSHIFSSFFLLKIGGVVGGGQVEPWGVLEERGGEGVFQEGDSGSS